MRSELRCSVAVNRRKNTKARNVGARSIVNIAGDQITQYTILTCVRLADLNGVSPKYVRKFSNGASWTLTILPPASREVDVHRVVTKLNQANGTTVSSARNA